MIHIFTLLFLITGITFANTFEIVKTYKTHGIEEVKKLLEKEYQTQEYWKYYLKDIDVTNGYYESINYLVLCQKNNKNITLYDTKNNKNILSADVFVGKKFGDKKREGDLKTPVGVYDLLKKLTKLDSFYGPLALTTNYPNIYDKSQGKTGHGIWIHGLPKKEVRDTYTKGCIALDNNEIKKLDKSINIKNSILLISEDKFKKTSKDEISMILSSLYQWKEHWTNSDIKSYFSFYSKHFKKANGTNFSNYKKYKTRIFKKNEKKEIIFSKINIIPYPNEKNQKLFKVTFNEHYKTNSYRFNGKKELYIKVENNSFFILSES